MLCSFPPEKLDLEFRKHCSIKLNQLTQSLEDLKKELVQTPIIKEEDIIIESLKINNDIQYGSRVLIKLADGTTKKGRVWGKKNYDDLYEINKDGLVNYQNISGKILINISVGRYLELERDIWAHEHKISELKQILDNSELPELLNADGFHIIEVVMIVKGSSCDEVHFVHAKNLKSGALKLPKDEILINGFYEIFVNTEVIIKTNLSSKTAFELFQNR